MTVTDSDSTATERITGLSPRRNATLAGPAAAAAFVGGTILAGLLTGTAWSEQPFDALGVVLHASVVVGGVLGLVFLRSLWAAADHPVRRGGIGLFAFALTAMAVVNGATVVTSTLPDPLGFLGFLGFMVSVPLALFVSGVGDVLAGTRARGLASLALGVAFVSGIVRPELYGAEVGELTALLGLVWLSLLSAWLVLQYASLDGQAA